MAPRKRQRKDVSPPPETEQADIAAAVVHLGRLAASHAGWGVALAAGLTEADDYPSDAESLATLAKVSRLLLADRERMRLRSTYVLKDRLYAGIKSIFAQVDAHPEIVEDIEDRVDLFVRELGFALGPAQEKRFAIDAEFIKERMPAQAAAEALLDAINGHSTPKSAGRSIFDAKDRQSTRAPVPAPMNRFVPLRTVRRYFEHSVQSVDAQRMRDTKLPLEALTSKAHAEALQHRVESLLKKSVSTGLEGGQEAFRNAILVLLRGEEREPGAIMTPEAEKMLAPYRERGRALGAELVSLSGGDASVLEAIADKGAQRLVAQLKEALDAE